MTTYSLILVTASPTTKYAWYALKLAQALQQQQHAIKVFFYQDGVQIANAFLWQPDDQINLQRAWQALGIALPVCVSAGLARGVIDAENAQRHHLQQHNLATGFSLVGLGELVDAITYAERVIQF